jgi:hypothetical protein
MKKETETERFNRITSQLDAISKKGWEVSDDKLDKMTKDIMENLGYEVEKPFVPLKPDLWGPMTEAELKRAESLGPLAKGLVEALKEEEDTGLKP